MSKQKVKPLGILKRIAAIGKKLKEEVEIHEITENGEKMYTLTLKGETTNNILRGYYKAKEFVEILHDIAQGDRNMVNGHPQIAKKGFVKRLIEKHFSKNK